MKKFLSLILSLSIILGFFAFVINAIVITKVDDKILTLEEASKLTDIDMIVVLGCKVWDENKPSHMLEDRLMTAIDVYQTGVCDKILMTGDSQNEKEYDETGVMKEYAETWGADKADILVDKLGLSTYESMYRLKELYGAKKVIVVTQGYHLSRALYCANELGVEAYGVESDLRTYGKAIYNNAREAVARVKDYFFCVAKPIPEIPLEK